MRKLKAYVASPYGFAESTRPFYYETLLPLIRCCHIEVIDPWALTPKFVIDAADRLPLGPEKVKAWKIVNRLIGGNNVLGIEQCDFMVAVLDGTDVDSGTAAEIGWGAAKGKPVAGYRGDFRPSGDNMGTLVNLQVEEFIYRSGGDIVTNLDDLKSLIERIKERIRCDAN